ncbi:MAG TPA: cell envelope integrity protein CreD [Burkholderiales bacterium]|nr:cell envelope integrity protein CreD [Burkholderiales bacterium]
MKNMLAHSALTKTIVLALLTLLAALPLAQIGGLVDERGNSRTHAAQQLAARHAGPQVVAGPVIVVPYTERWTDVHLDDNGKVKQRIEHALQRGHVVFPESSKLRGRLTAEERYLGIFTVLFYNLKAGFNGRFPAFDPASIPHTHKGSAIETQLPVLAFATSDLRGLQGAPVLTIAGASARWQPRVPGANHDSWLAQGIHAPLPAAALHAFQQRQPVDFQLDVVLVGQERLAVVPLADENTAHLTSAWPHPSFGGKFLAVRRTVSDQGFEAEWSVSSLVSSARTQFVQGGRPPLETFDVSLVEPLNVYALTNRALKYGLLFVALTLMAAFMFELFAHLKLHPVQYGLVALSLTLFFLLLLALSEKIAFGLAYAIAAAASTLLLVVYFSAVLKGWRRGLGLGGYVGTLYGVLYGLLSSEDNALLLGSLLLFGLMAVLMIGTRKVDWYALSARPGQQAPVSA